MKPEKLIINFEKALLYLTLLLIPLAVIPLFSQPFIFSKIILLVFGVGLIVILKISKILTQGKLETSTSQFDLPVLIFCLAYLLSALLVTPNKMEAFLLPGSGTIILLSGLLYLLIRLLENKEKSLVALVLFLSGVLVSITILLAVSGLWEKIPQLPSFIKNTIFTPLGGSLLSAIYLGALLPLGINCILKTQDLAKKIFLSMALLILIFGLVISIYQSLPGKDTSPQLLDFNSSLSIATETIKQSPILGIGPGNYLTAFNLFRPINYNQTSLWNLRFLSSRSHWLTVITETGLAGLVALVVLGATLKKAWKNKELTIDLELVSFLGLTTLFVFFPSSVALTVLFFALLGLISQKKTTQTIVASAKTPLLVFIFPVLIAFVFLLIYSTRLVQAEIKFQKALQSLTQNNGEQTHKYFQEAIKINNLVDRYHSAYSQVHLLSAQAVAQTETISDEEKRTSVSQFVQAAIAEAKSGVNLNRQRSGSWELLARTYKTLIPFAQGADDFAISAYKQAIALDPINPNLRLALGGIYYAQGDYDTAIDIFKLAAIAKPDFANAHYNLAYAYREKNEIQKAITEMSQVLALVDQGSSDYELAKVELEKLEKSLKETKTEEKAPAENLTPPEEAQEPVITPPLELPEESSLPSSED